jgi:hypothetical protein
MTPNPDDFQFYIEFPTPRPVTGINGTLKAYGVGIVVLVDNNNNIHELHKVMFVPGLEDSIISKHWTKKQGLKTTIDDDEEITLSSKSGFKIKTSSIHRISAFPDVKTLEYDPDYFSKVNAIIDEEPMAYEWNQPPPTPPKVLMVSTPFVDEGQLWHERLGHISAERLRRLGIEHAPDTCNFCLLGKQTHQPFQTNKEQSNLPLELVYSDICGPISPTSIGNSRYFISFIDDCTRYCWIYPIPDKSSKTIL